MKAKQLLILVCAAVILGGLAHVTNTRRNKQASSADTGKDIFPALKQDETLKSIERIVVRSADRTITFARIDNTWVAPEKYNYPVDFGKVRDFVRKIADLTVGQSSAGGDDQIETLHLVSPDSGQTNKTEHMGTLVRLEDKDSNPVISMVLGKERMTKSPSPAPRGRPGGYPDGRYLLADGKVALVSEGFHDLPGKPQDWFDSSLVNVPSADIVDITITAPDKKTVTLKRPEGAGNFLVQGFPEKEELDTSKVNTVSGILNYLSFDDIADPALADKTTGLDNPTVYVARTSKGQVYTLRIGKSAEGTDNRYLKIQVAYQPPEKPADDEGDETEEDEAADKERKELISSTSELNEKIEPWTYLVRPYGVDSVSADKKDYIKKEESAQEPEPTEEKEEEKKEKGLLRKLMPWRK
jgi:hypothetical protein